jgi:hypothetical protein
LHSRRYQFHTAAYAPHAARFASLFTLRPDAARALDAAVARARRSGGGGTAAALLGVHVRGGEGFTPLLAAGEEDNDDDDGDTRNAAAAPAFAAAPAEAASDAGEAWAPPAQGGLFSSCTTGAWRDTGVFWVAPLEWCARAPQHGMRTTPHHTTPCT